MIKDPTLALTKEWKRTNVILLFSFLFISISAPSFVQAQSKNILFYNVENLFDVEDDSIKSDEEFLPTGVRYWNKYKYHQKLKNISQVIYESGGFNLPIIIGLCEVENKKVLADLIFNTGLNNVNYFPIHFESPDLRGIDVALLYRSDAFKLDSAVAIPVVFDAESRPTRDILHVYGFTNDNVALHVFVNHWPSRYGGVMQAHHKRKKAADILSNYINELIEIDSTANVVVMGDFNDNPNDESLMHLSRQASLINLCDVKENGTIKYKHEWHTFDQVLVSENLESVSQFRIIDFDYLKVKDESHSGTKLNRTYVGYKYNGGYSDHLPVMLSLDFGE